MGHPNLIRKQVHDIISFEFPKRGPFRVTGLKFRTESQTHFVPVRATIRLRIHLAIRKQRLFSAIMSALKSTPKQPPTPIRRAAWYVLQTGFFRWPLT